MFEIITNINTFFTADWNNFSYCYNLFLIVCAITYCFFLLKSFFLLSTIDYKKFELDLRELFEIPNDPAVQERNIDRNKIIERGILHKSSIQKVNNVLNSFGHDILSIEECVLVCTKLNNKPMPFHFELNEKQVSFFAQIYNHIKIEIEREYYNNKFLLLHISFSLFFIMGTKKIFDLTSLYSIFLIPIFAIFLLQIIHKITPYRRFSYKIDCLKSKIENNIVTFAYYVLYKNTLDEYNAINEKIALEKAFAAKKEREEQERKRKEHERLELEKQFKLKKHVKTYWYSLDGFAFEKEIAKLYKMLGYKVETTKLVGDGGVDLILYKDEKKIIVQCKAHKHKIGPEPVRALWGVKDDFNADEVILIALSGITTGAMDFVKNKKYQILDADDIATLSISVNYINYDAKINK